LDRQVVDVLSQLREDNRYIRGLVSWVGFPQSAVVYERDARYAGETKYSLAKMVRLAADGITSFSERPLRLAFSVGAIIMVVASLLAAYIVFAKLADPASSIPGFCQPDVCRPLPRRLSAALPGTSRRVRRSDLP